MSIDPRFVRDRGDELFNGNELLVKGALETEGGVHLLTGYPGSPVATFFDVLGALRSMLREKGICATIANNEALSVAMLNGSQMAPVRAMAVMKSVGLHVASDGLALANLAGAHADGGAVVVVGDDPWSESTQVPSDSRFLARHLRMPVIEPATPQEVKDYIDLAFKLSRASGFYLCNLVTTTLADGGGNVTCRPNHYPLTNMHHPFELATYGLNTEATVLLPPRTGRREEQLDERVAQLHAASRRLGSHMITGASARSVGIVTAGMAYQYVGQALVDLGLWGEVPLLKLAVTYPLDEQVAVDFARTCEHVLVVEERRSFIEEQLVTALRHAAKVAGATVPTVWGKRFPDGEVGLPETRGLTVSIVADALVRFLETADPASAPKRTGRVQVTLDVIGDTAKTEVDLPGRTPTFCPGCPHRDSSSVLLEIQERFRDDRYMKQQHARAAVDLVFHGDTGCYTMLMFPPNGRLMHNYSGMGLGGATGAGIDPFITNKQVVFLGDGTFFHSGMSAISNSIQTRQDITYIILENKTTAMTGHQPHAGLEIDLLGRETPGQNIEAIVTALGGVAGCSVVRVDPARRDAYRHVLERTILADGVKVIIADKECGITFHRRRRRAERAEYDRQGFVRRQRHMNVTEEVCELCLVCTSRTGCPGLTTVQTDYGLKIGTDLSWCVNDGACARLDACPSFEEVVITRRRPARQRGSDIQLDDLPEPVLAPTGDVWRAWLAGVGGMGIGTASEILVRAGRNAGFEVRFADKKGLAIRNGGVFSQVIYARGDAPVSQTIPYGQADLLLGLDALEALRAADPALPFRVLHPERTVAVINTDKTPTIGTLLQREDFEPADLERQIQATTRADQYYGHPISTMCERLFGTKLYANLTMLGVAYQRGLIPVSPGALTDALEATVRVDVEKNLRAFNLGRKLATHPELFAERQPPRTLARIVREKATYLNMRRLGVRKALTPNRPAPDARLRLPETPLARRYKHLVFTTLRACRELDRETMRDIAVRIYDLVQWGGVRYARTYAQQIRRVFLADDPAYGFAATRAVIWNLAKLMLIKDEFYVAHLLTSYEKIRRDRQRFNVNPGNGDKLGYRRTFHPRFFGRKVSIRLPHAALYVLRSLRGLRRVLPLYHREDRRFLAWYRRIVEGFAYDDRVTYERYVEVLRLPEQVTGYREYRSPKIEAARNQATSLLASLRAESVAREESRT
jgi:indolepyruvate ferredoxin oxidoreductase